MSNIVKKTSGAVATRSAALDRIRSAKAAKPLAGSRAAPVVEQRPRLVFGVDATASRQPAWESAQRITDRMFDAIPGALDVALAVHGGSRVHTFTQFSSDVGLFRGKAAAVRCMAGETKLCDLMERALESGGVRVMSYIGDAFEESREMALALADRFRARGIRLVILADQPSPATLEFFQQLVARAGGAVLDFRAEQLDVMGEVLEGVAALAVGGRKLLAGRGTAGARLLLEGLRE